jgi:hypothetical protein
MDMDNGGVLPNDYGNFELQREWAKKMDPVVYKGSVMANPSNTAHRAIERLNMLSKNGRLVFNTACAGIVGVFTINGEMVDKVVFNKSGSHSLANKARGLYLVKFTPDKGLVQTIPMINR